MMLRCLSFNPLRRYVFSSRRTSGPANIRFRPLESQQSMTVSLQWQIR